MPKKKTGKHLQFYMDCMERLVMPGDGLCLNTKGCGGPLSDDLLDLLTPTDGDLLLLRSHGHSTSYWATGINDRGGQYDAFTPLRQTIVLFMAAINNEL